MPKNLPAFFLGRYPAFVEYGQQGKIAEDICIRDKRGLSPRWAMRQRADPASHAFQILDTHHPKAVGLWASGQSNISLFIYLFI